MELKDKVILITGGSKGIGKAAAKSFLKEGAIVIICSRSEDEINKAAKEISSGENICISLKCDVKKSADIKNMTKEVIAKFKHIDILINNAGTSCYKTLVETTEEEWDNTINVNLKGAFLLCKECIPHMKNGIIVNISSGAGKHGFPMFSAYCASKFGVIGLTESLASEVPHIKVYALCPGPVNTELFRSIFNYSPPVQPEDIADTLISLCKEESFPSGASIEI